MPHFDIKNSIRRELKIQSARTSISKAEVPESSRAHEIDGIRGWAALIVLLFHLFWEVFGAIIPQFRWPPMKLILNGELAVYIFFVLSGDALSWAYVQTSRPVFIDKLVLKRYLRLAVPIFFACSVVYVLMLTGFTFHKAATPIVNREDWLGAFLHFEPSLDNLVRYSLAEVFVNPGMNSYNPFLWTMRIEIIGSLHVFLFLLVLPRLKQATMIACGGMVMWLLIEPLYSLFYGGIILSLLRKSGALGRIRESSLAQYVSPVLLLAGIWIAAYSEFFPYDVSYRWLVIAKASQAVVIVYAIYTQRMFLTFATSRISKYLGQISFPLYLLHFAVIVSFTSYLIVWYSKTRAIDIFAATTIGLASTLASILAATFAMPIERYFLVRLGRLIDRGEVTVNTKFETPTVGKTD